MAIITNLPTDKLSSWYFATRWGKYHVEQSIHRAAQAGLDTTYDQMQLQQLEDLEQFLKMSWDVVMEDLCGKPVQTLHEVSNGDS